MPVRFILGMHNHQPVGNFDSVFAQAAADAYQPFLDLIAQFPKLPFVLHTSGSLLEWLEVHRKSYVRDLQALVRRGQCEILGGGWYEPILTMLPRRDRVGQLRRYAEHLHGLFGVKPRGAWLAERVWEPSLASDLAEAGVEYTLLDDHQFRQAGLGPDELHQPFLTEDEGRLVKVFPISEPMRYLVPWKSAAEAVQHLVWLHGTHPDAVAVCADDGEKFGAWPGTHEHCFTKNWLKEFFERLIDEAAAGTIRLQTLAQTADEAQRPPLIYLPDGSYREMTEWALPARRQVERQRALQKLEALPAEDANAVRGFLRAGLWSNFRAKYPEVREMYARMLEVSGRVEAARQAGHAKAGEAAQELYRAQCNCAYWHGAFGGLYLPHLRHAVYRHLLAAENLLLPEAVRAGRRLETEIGDFNLDGENEVRLGNARLVAHFDPGQGGTLFGLDLRPQRCNLQASLARRFEPYHETILEAAKGKAAKAQVSLVEETARFKQAGLELLLTYDPWPRHSLLDRFWDGDADLARVRAGHAEERGDFLGQPFAQELSADGSEARLTMKRIGAVLGQRVTLTKAVTLRAAGDSLEVAYRLEDLPKTRLRFGVEFMVAGMAASQPDRFFSLPSRPNAGPLETVLDETNATQIALTDQWLKLRTTLSWDRPGGLWAWPQQTVSQSEGGFEAVHQGNLLVPHWRLDGAPTWEIRFVWRFETL